MGEIIDRGSNSVIRVCPICGKNFIPSNEWAYKKSHVYYCRYNCYKKAGGDSGKPINYTRERPTNIKRKIEQ